MGYPFWDSKEEYRRAWKMTGNHNSGRKARYVTVDRFEKFVNNEFFHLRVEVRVATFVVGLSLVTVVAIALKVFLG